MQFEMIESTSDREMDIENVQCLIFVAYEEAIPDILQPLPFQRTQFYALVPNLHRHNDIQKLLHRHEVQILRRPPFDSFLAEAIKHDRVEFLIIEFFRDLGKRWGIEVPVFNEDFVQNIFRGCSFTHLTFFFGFFESKNALNDENVSIIRELANIRLRGDDDGSFLHFAAHVGHFQLVYLLLESGALVNARTFCEDQTPLHMAAFQLSELIAALLLEGGAEVDAVCSSGSKYDGATPLHLALLRLQDSPLALGLGVIELLLSNGASVDAEFRLGNVLQMTALTNMIKALRFVLGHQPDLQKTGNREALRVVLGKRRYMKPLSETIFLMLRDYGCRLSPKDSKNLQLLAGASARPEFMEDLLKWGASVEYSSRAAKMMKRSSNIKKYLLNQAIQDKRFDSVRFLLMSEDSYRGHAWGVKKIISKGHLTDFSPVIAKDVLDSAYFRLSIFLILDFRPLFTIDENEEIPDYKKTEIKHFKGLVFKHMRSLLALNLKRDESFIHSAVPYWVLEAMNCPALLEHEAEVAKMQRETIAGSNYSFYDIVNSSFLKVSHSLDTASVLEALRAEDYKERFPIYSPIISWRFRKASYRKTLFDQGIKMFDFLYKEYPELPFEIKEKIMDHLSNLDLLVLVNVCKLS